MDENGDVIMKEGLPEGNGEYLQINNHPEQVSNRVTRGSAEEERKNGMSINDRMEEVYQAITQAYKNCRERVKKETSLKKSGEFTVVNDCFKGAVKEADKAWEGLVKAINAALDANSTNEREANFLKRVGLNSLDDVEVVMRENSEEIHQFRQLTNRVKEIEGVEDIVGLLEKINDEREALVKERAEWSEMRTELNEVKEIANLKEGEQLADRWKDINVELQTLMRQFGELKMKMEKEENSAIALVDTVEELEKQVETLIEEKKRMKAQIDEQLARLVRAEDANEGQYKINQNREGADQLPLSELQRNERKKRQDEVLQRMKRLRDLGGTSPPQPNLLESQGMRGLPSSTALITGPSFNPLENGNGGMGDVGDAGHSHYQNQYDAGTGSNPGVYGIGGEGIRNSDAVLGRSFGLMGNALPRMARYSGRKEDWEDFETGFMIRYGKMDTAIALSLLKDNLNEEAKDALRSVPVEEKAKGVKDVLKWLRARLSKETPFEEIELDKMLRHQRIDGKTVGKVCEELEEWTAKLHPEENKKESIRRRQLLILYEGKHTEYVRLLSLFREGTSYSMMKAALVELEYLKKTERESKGHNTGSSPGLKCFRCGGYGHKEYKCVSKNGNGGPGGGSGHYGNSGGTNGTYRGGYSGPNRGGYSGGRGGNNYGGGQRPQNSYGYGNGGARAQAVAAPANGYNGRPNANGWASTPYSGQQAQNGWAYTPNPGQLAHNGRTGSPNVMGMSAQGSNNSGYFARGAGANAGQGRDNKGVQGVNLVQSDDDVPIREVNTEVLNTEDHARSANEEQEEFFFIKRRKLVKGNLSGVPVEVLLDTGADVSIISANVVNLIEKAVVNQGVKPVIKDASNGVMNIIGRTILEVDLEVGKKTSVGFYVVDNDLGKVIIGGKGLEDIGVELREVEFREKEHSKGNEAIVLRDARIEPGQLGSIWVTGSENNTVMLESSIEQVLEGIAVTERIVNIPVFNDTESELQFTKNQPVGFWRIVAGKVEEMKVDNNRKGVVSDNRDAKVEWKDIREKLVANRGQELEKPLEEVLWRNVNAFAKGDEDIGRLANWECSVDVMDGKPIRQKPRPIPFAIREKLRALVGRMMRQGVVKKSQSPWSSPIVVVKKKDGSLRLCIDYRKVNQMIRLDAQPLPHLESTIQSLSGKKFFSTIDLQSGFWQVGLAEGSRELTAFSLLGEHFEFQVLPFGLNVSPCQFQRAMMEMLKEEIEKEGKDRKVFCYIDDILVATETEEDHVKMLHWVLRRIIERGVKVNPSKCSFMMKSVEYLGHYVSDKGVSMEQRKVVAVKNYPRPKNSSEVRSFVGLASYYRRFVKGFAKIAEPLHEMTKKEVEWKWGLNEEKAFNELKKAITEAPVLIQPDCEAAIKGTKPFYITTDASGHGIGGVLSQANESGVEQPVAFYSRSLKGPERNYSIIDLEALAIFEAARKWKYLIFGTNTTVRTDHAPLTSMFKRQNVCPRILRWAAEMLPYKLDIIHVKGRDNVVADSLSRFPVDSNCDDSKEPVTIGEDIVINAMTRLKLKAEKRKDNKDEVTREINDSISRWKELQGEDEWAKEMITLKKEGGTGNGSEIIRMPDSTRKFTLADLEVDKGILYILDRDHERKLYVPPKERNRLIREMHESVLVGHQGGKKMNQLLRKEYVWGAMEKDIASVLRECDLCLRSKPRKRYIPELHPREAKAPLEMVAVDLIDMGKGKQGNRYILTIIDLFTRYACACPLKDKKATTVARAFMNSWILKGGRVPKALLSDNGGEFVNEVFEEINKMWKIERKCTLPYHSRANGGVERLNRTINETLRRLVGRTDEWEDALPYALYCYNTVPHGATGESPSFLFHGRDDGLPVGEPWKVNEKYVVDLDDYKSRMMLLMKRTQEEVNERLKGERERMKAGYDKKWENNKKHEPVVGDRVYVYKERGDEQNPKLGIKWEGPFRVVERSSTTATLVGIEKGEERIVQLDKLRKVPRKEGEIDVIYVNELSTCRRIIDRESPLHWENVCPACEGKPRLLKDIWKGCPAEFGSFSFPSLKEFAIMKTLIEKFPNLTPVRAQKLLSMGDLTEEEEITEKTIEEVVGNLCQHALVSLRGPQVEWRFTVRDLNPRFEEAYRRGLGEDVDTSLGYGAVVHQPGIPITKLGGDKARWEWKIDMHSEWNELFSGWHRMRTRKTIKNLLVMWPRLLEQEDMTALKDMVIHHTEKNAWNVVIIMEPCGGTANPDYIPFLIQWSSERPKTGNIRVIVTDSAVTDGTPIPTLERIHPWIRREHWEFATQAWVEGKPWNVKEAESELEDKGWKGVNEGKRRERREEEVDIPKLNQVIHDRRRNDMNMSGIICGSCGGNGHKDWKCPNNRKKGYFGRGRPAAKEGDVREEAPYKKKKY